MPVTRPSALRSSERLLWLAVVVFAASFRWSTGSAPSASPGQPQQLSTIAWQSDIDTALVEARQAGRPVLVDFSASWCPSCIAMKHGAWLDAGVENTIAASYIPVQVDVDRSPAVSDRFGVEAIPTILVLDDEARVVRRAGFMAVPEMQRFLAGQ